MFALACLLSETVAECHKLGWQLVPSEKFICVHASKRNFSSANQALLVLSALVICEVVHLRRGVSGLKPTRFHHRLPCDVRRGHWSEPSFCNQIQGPVTQGKFKQCCFVFEEHEFGAGKFGGTCKVEQVKFVADFKVGNGFSELWLL